MASIPQRYAPFLFAIIQAGITTGFATAIATYDVLPLGPAFVGHWLQAWLVAWSILVPVVIVAAPFIQRAVARITAQPRQAPTGGGAKSRAAAE